MTQIERICVICGSFLLRRALPSNCPETLRFLWHAACPINRQQREGDIMEALIEAILVFVAIPAAFVAMAALAIYGAAVAIRSFATPRTAPRVVAEPATVVAFTPRRRVEAVEVRRAA
jgi:hypothetical protein